MSKRCQWANNDDLTKQYHDTEWGIPKHNDQQLFELLILEGMQAGLNWSTILKKRENFQKAFDKFDYNKISNYSEKKVEDLLQDKGIIRNKLKIEAVITNAKAFLKIVKDFGTFDSYIWNFVNNEPIINKWKLLSDIPSNTELSDIISKDLKKKGFKFVGSTIIYAFLQAIGIVDDHLVDCFCHSKNTK